jgi:hypothetical protein
VHHSLVSRIQFDVNFKKEGKELVRGNKKAIFARHKE